MPTDAFLPPTEDMNESPVHRIYINERWWSYISGEVQRLAYESAWEGTQDEKEAGVEKIFQFLSIDVPIPLITFFDDSATPDTSDSSDTAEVSLGLRFTSAEPGYIIGVKFYKDAANDGTHTAKMWDDSTTLYASKDFTGETASGWQKVIFDDPVAIESCNEYKVAYHAPNGHYSYTRPYYDVAHIVYPLTAPIDAGVYGYGDVDTIPTSTYLSSNYFVQPIFSLTGK